MKNRNLAKIDNAYVASNVEKKSINKDPDNVYVSSPKTKFVKGECSQ